jgi:hypothetical protein
MFHRASRLAKGADLPDLRANYVGTCLVGKGSLSSAQLTRSGPLLLVSMGGRTCGPHCRVRFDHVPCGRINTVNDCFQEMRL